MGCCHSKKSVAINGAGPGIGHMGNRPSRDQYYDSHANSHTVPTATTEPPAQPKPGDGKTEEEKQVLKVASVDLKIPENAQFHRTDKYELTTDRTDGDKKLQAQLVIRRGQPFDLAVTFDRPFDSSKDDLRIIFTVGSKPIESKGTMVTLLLSDVDKPLEWGAQTLKSDGQTLNIRIFTPPNAFVAKWNFAFDTILKKGTAEKKFRYTHPQPIYILFNAWCKNDQVYMDDETSRQEYVLNDMGRLYRGTTKQIFAKPWNFGQFEDFVLECIMWLLEQAMMNYRVRADPVHVVRKISALVNDCDDKGVLVGNWSGDYAGGRSPLSWAGSVAILEQFWKTKRPVKYGQCWVFSGVVVTACRTLGIPCRSVTNFASAHDVDASITIDCYWNADGTPNNDLSMDSVWNFHVWNDVWMSRPDLPSGFGGWQAIDATPQETSEGVYCCGPVSIEAIKNGLVNLPYDGPFLFAEVNADRLHWIKDGDNWNNTKEHHSIGKNLSTKNPQGDERMDISFMYKFPEGSQMERTAVWRAIKEGSSRQDVYTVDVEDMTFDLIERDDTQLGQSFDVTLKCNNESTEARTVKITLTASIVYYTGVPVKNIKSQSFSCKCPAKASGEVTMNVKPEEYISKLVDMCLIKISSMVQVEETNQFHCEADDFRLLKPDIVVKVPSEVKVGEEYEVEYSFKNPLPRSLTKCVFEVEGASLQRPRQLKHNSVGPHAEAKGSVKLQALIPGDKEIIVNFDSKELSDLAGSSKFKVV